MKSFKDNKGRIWDIVVNVGTVKRVKGMVDVNILELMGQGKDAGDDLATRLSTDIVLLVDTLYAICKPECDSRNITDDDFGSALTGDCISDACHALLEEIVDFFPDPRRSALKRVLKASMKYEQEASQRLMKMLDEGQVENLIDAQLQTMSDTSTNAQASAE